MRVKRRVSARKGGAYATVTRPTHARVEADMAWPVPYDVNEWKAYKERLALSEYIRSEMQKEGGDSDDEQCHADIETCAAPFRASRRETRMTEANIRLAHLSGVATVMGIVIFSYACVVGERIGS